MSGIGRGPLAIAAWRARLAFAATFCTRDTTRSLAAAVICAHGAVHAMTNRRIAIPALGRIAGILVTPAKKKGLRTKRSPTATMPRQTAAKPYGLWPMPPSRVIVSPFMYLKSGPQS